MPSNIHLVSATSGGLGKCEEWLGKVILDKRIIVTFFVFVFLGEKYRVPGHPYRILGVPPPSPLRFMRVGVRLMRTSAAKRKQQNVAVVLFDAVELIDVTGAFQALHAAREENSDKKPFNVCAVAERQASLLTEAGVTIIPDYTIDSAPRVDILIVPGGIGARTAAFNERLMHWITRTAAEAQLVVSLSTGALLLGKAGLLNGLEVTTHHRSLDLLRQVAKNITLRPEMRFVDSGRIITSGGGSASIDVCLYIVARVCGAKRAIQAAHNMEYRHWDSTWAEHLEGSM